MDVFWNNEINIVEKRGQTANKWMESWLHLKWIKFSPIKPIPVGNGLKHNYWIAALHTHTPNQSVLIRKGSICSFFTMSAIIRFLFVRSSVSLFRFYFHSIEMSPQVQCGVHKWTHLQIEIPNNRRIARSNWWQRIHWIGKIANIQFYNVALSHPHYFLLLLSAITNKC